MAEDDTSDETLFERATRVGPRLRGTLADIASYFARHPDQVATSSAKDIAKVIGTSDASVIRAARALGYRGMKEVRKAAMSLVASRADPGAVIHRRMHSTTAGSHLRTVIDDTAVAVEQFRETISDTEWNAIVQSVADSDHVACYGLSPTGFIADYLAFFLSRVGLSADSSRASGVLLADELVQLAPGTVLIVFAPIREFDEITVACQHARKLGLTVILITEAIGMPIRETADHVITTSPTSLSSASDASIPLLVSQALVNAVAAQNPERALERMEGLNQLRTAISGQDILLTAEKVGLTHPGSKSAPSNTTSNKDSEGISHS
ncbi:MurR/RpiR family transcriptional regulator [Brevibacterium atlanticum]|uniref:MurR/RpiR family transcriptional regulator n=1 Tax=Brevibacterium atlanticum TaxID=2697563 RepID=UPI00141DD39C|nr:MurR/RpiR family transcriptional regulator [Brevibacterium atlanticum]